MAKDLPAFWTVEVDRGLEREKSYILTSGDPERPEKDKPVEPGWPFCAGEMDFREGRIEAFSDWLTAQENPLFARVAVNRLWQWHFGEGLQKTSSDFGILGGRPASQPLLDWLASEFVARRLQHEGDAPADGDFERLSPGQLRRSRVDDDESRSRSASRFLWRFRLQRLEAEPIWDSILTAAGNLDPTVGGPSFDIEARAPARTAADAVHAGGGQDEPPRRLHDPRLFHQPRGHAELPAGVRRR